MALKKSSQFGSVVNERFEKTGLVIPKEKDEVLRVRIPKRIKEQFTEYCHHIGSCPSAEMRKYIYEILREKGILG
jgi:hypothetical protein